jgi:hypothetical protein
MKSTDKYIRRDPNCVWRVIDKNALIVKIEDTGGSRVYTLNKTGTAIWESMNGKQTVDEIIANVRNKFACPKTADIAADVHVFTDRLINRGLFEPKLRSMTEIEKGYKKRGDTHDEREV